MAYTPTITRTRLVAREALNYLRDTSAQNGDLVRNSAALVVGSGTTAVLGFVYWWLAARSFAPEVVGRASALFALMALVGLIGEAGLGTLLTGEIIRRPGRERGLIAAAAIAALLLSLAGGGAGWLLSGLAHSAASVGAGGFVGLWFLLGCGLTGLSYIVDQAFVGMLRSGVRMLRQLLFSLCKLVFIAIAAVWASGEAAILATWIAGQVISLGAVEAYVRRRQGSLLRRPDFALLHSLRRKAAGHYLLDLASQTPSIIMPYLVTVLLSPAINAAFSAIWMVFTVASVVPAAFATVLFPAVNAAPRQYRSKMMLSLSVSQLFAVAFALFIFVYSQEILRVFNPAYAELTGASLRWLGFGLIGAVVKFHVCTAARLNNSMHSAAIWFALGGLCELAGAILGCRIAALEGLAVGWTATIIAEAGVMIVVAWCVNRRILIGPDHPAE